ncbi:MAG: tRNA (adenosine(37)-N6)-dimethylallyltransferase MiaA [Paludibacteraceae bacterium]|nr:tRNA (adenosine(37)-N6)-dimethylallyltransferase MiaA [Paludibacteraceae bacterium]
MANPKTLLLILGPTAVGKTELALRVAEHLRCPIVNCDSRQIYREIPIGTAAPTPAEQARVHHYFVGTHALDQDHNAGKYEQGVLSLLSTIFAAHDVAILTGGSMLYADAVCHGLDDLPAVPPEVRESVNRGFEQGGLVWLQSEVQRLDPAYWQIVDRQNPARLRHCVELSMVLGKPYSSLRTNSVKERPFRIVKVGLDRPRAELYARVDERVRQMMDAGFLEEAKSVYPHRRLNSLQTVGYKELFAYLDGEYDLNRAIELIQQNTRHYAKRQLTWLRRDKDIHWLDAREEYEKNIDIIDSLLRADCMQEK